jgi:hypothetical protein
MITILIILVLLMLLSGYGYGWRAGSIDPGGLLGILFLVVIVILLFSLISPVVHGYWYPNPVR